MSLPIRTAVVSSFRIFPCISGLTAASFGQTGFLYALRSAFLSALVMSSARHDAARSRGSDCGRIGRNAESGRMSFMKGFFLQDMGKRMRNQETL